MTLPASGTLAASQVNIELGKAAGATINMSDTVVRTLFGKSSGTISWSDGLGKSNNSAAPLVNPLNGVTFADTDPNYQYCDLRIIFKTDGSIAYYSDTQANGVVYFSKSPAYWCATPGPGVGNSYWLNNQQLNVDRILCEAYQPSAESNTVTASATANFSLSSGGSIVMTSTGWICQATT